VKGTLLVCATPIGNLDDVSPRLRSTLEAADVVFAEDTRRTGKLLERFGIEAELRSFFVGNEQQRLGELRERLRRGETVALVSDAGMPSVSDPGVLAVRMAADVGATVSVVPGPSAVTSALAVSGLGGDRFVFEGDDFEFCELLHPTLHLFGFGGLGAEAVDEVLSLLDFALLSFVLLDPDFFTQG